MYTKIKGYSPQINYQSSTILRRLAWLQGKPMTKTLEQLILQAGLYFSSKKKCKACKSSKKLCKTCFFKEGAAPAKASALKNNN